MKCLTVAFGSFNVFFVEKINSAIYRLAQCISTFLALGVVATQ